MAGLSAWPVTIVWIAAVFAAWALVTYARRALRKPKRIEPDDPDHRRIYPNLPLGQFIEVDGFKIRFIQKGQGPDVILVHGFAESIITWRLIFNDLAERYRVTALDLPGFGFSSKFIDRDYDLETQAKRLSDIVAALKIDRPMLVGHSMGAALIAWMAKSTPEKMNRIALIAPAINPAVVRLHPLAAQWLGALLKSFIVTPTMIRQIYLKYCVVDPPADLDLAVPEFYRPYHQSPEAVTVAARHSWLLYDKRLPAAIRDLSCPVLVIAGENDQVVKLSLVEEFLQLNPAARSVVLPRTGHQIQEEKPREVLAELCSFFDS